MRISVVFVFILCCSFSFAQKSGKDAVYLNTTKMHHDTYTNPVLAENFPDPSVQKGDDGLFYAYATGCKTAVSDDLVHWTIITKAIDRPTWNDTTYVASDGTQKTDKYSFWACDVSKNTTTNKYIMQYACALWGNETRTGLGIAIGDTPTKFTDMGRLFRSTEIGVQNSIDPVYFEDGNKKYMAWGSFRGIYLAELEEDGLHLKNWNNKTKIAGTAFEGTMIHKRGNYYYLICSIGSCCAHATSTYKLVVGRSTSINGPYLNKTGGRMLDNKYTLLLSGNERWKGPGHCSEVITDDNGEDWLLYHSYDVQQECAERLMLLDRITWSEDGWPSINDGYPSSEPVKMPVFKNDKTKTQALIQQLKQTKKQQLRKKQAQKSK